MIDYLLSSQPPGKGVDIAETGLPNLIANIALIVGVLFLKPVVEQHFGSNIHENTPVSLPNRQTLKVIFDARNDLLFPALDGLSAQYLKANPVEATIATAVTVVKGVPTPVQLSQEQSTMGVVLGIFACVMLALAGTVLTFQRYRDREGSYFSETSSPAPSSHNGSSSPQPFGRPPNPPSDDEDGSSGSGGRTPPIPILDLFYNGPISRVDKAVDTGDEKVGDMDGAPPPPPPSFPTPVEDGDAFKRNPSIFKWLSLTLVLSIIFLVINRLFNRFFKSHGKTQQEVYIPVASERVTEHATVTAITRDLVISYPSRAMTSKIQPTSVNTLPLVETETIDDGTPTPIMSTVSQRSRKFINIMFSLLITSCLALVPLIARCFIDDHLARIMKYFFPTETRQSAKGLDIIEITHPIDENVSIEDENTVMNVVGGGGFIAGIDEEDGLAGINGENVADTGVDQDFAFDIVEDIVAGIAEGDIVTAMVTGIDSGAISLLFLSIQESSLLVSIDEGVMIPATDEGVMVPATVMVPAVDEGVVVGTDTEDIGAGASTEDVTADINVATSGEEENMAKILVEEEASFNYVGNSTLVVQEKTSPLGVNLEDSLYTSEDGIPFHEAFSALSISGSSDEIHVFKETSSTLTHPMYKLPTKFENKSTVGGSQGIKVFSEHVPMTNIPVTSEKIRTVSKFTHKKTASLTEKFSRTAKVDITSKENVPNDNINRTSGTENLPILVKNSATNTKIHTSTEALNPKAPSFVPPSRLPVRERPRQSSSTSLHYSHPFLPKLGLSASMHAHSPQREGLSSSIRAPSSLPKQGSSASIDAPSSSRPGSSTDIHAPCTPRRDSSVHAPSSPGTGSSTNDQAPSLPPKQGLSASTHSPSSQSPGSSAKDDVPSSPPKQDLSASIHSPSSPSTGSSTNDDVAISPPKQGLSASIHCPSSSGPGSSTKDHTPSSPPKQGLSVSIHPTSSQSPGPSTKDRASSSPPKQSLSSSIHSTSSPGPGSSTKDHAPSSPPKQGLSASMHAPSSSRPGSSTNDHAPCTPRRENLSASIHASSSPRPGSSTNNHAPCTPRREDLNASMHAFSSQRPGSSTKNHAPCTPRRENSNASIHAPIEHDSELPMEPIAIPVVNLSPNHRARRSTDPERECDIVVLVNRGPVSP